MIIFLDYWSLVLGNISYGQIYWSLVLGNISYGQIYWSLVLGNISYGQISNAYYLLRIIIHM